MGRYLMRAVMVSMMAGLLTMGLFGAPADASAAGKYAIILQAGIESHEGMARAVHALLYAKELHENGHEVVLIFDGAGTEWAAELGNPASVSPIKPMYDQLREAGITEVVCDYCASAFSVKESLVTQKAPLVGEYAGHPSIAKWVSKGYQLLVL